MRNYFYILIAGLVLIRAIIGINDNFQADVRRFEALKAKCYASTSCPPGHTPFYQNLNNSGYYACTCRIFVK